MQLNLAIPSEAVDPSELLNETAPNSLQEDHIKTDQQQQQESTILLNIRQELSEFIGGGTSSGSTDITKNPELDDNDDDEMIHVDYLKDALTEEYIQIMEEQLASSVPRSENPLQDQLEQENLDSLINNDPTALAAESVVAGEHTTGAEAHSGLINGLHCAVCNITFDSEKMYQKHLEKHSEGLFNCNHCPRQFTDKNQFDVHQRRHSVNARPHCCETCGKRFGTRSLLNTHNKSHLGEKDHVCTVCGKGFTLPWQLKAHSRIHTNEKPFECPYCQKRFNQNGNLMIHIRIHTGEKPFQCSLCEKAFSAQGELIGHMRQHTGEKKVKKVVCTVCEKTFASKGDLNIHMRSHTKERPYGCQLCGKAFMLHVHLTVHMRSHTGEKPFACTLCEKAFPTNHQLKNHSHVHTGEKNYACDVCNRRFSTSANRNTHRKMHDRKIS